MATSLKKFVSRAPRYVFRPSDDQFLRYAHKDNRDQSFTTRLIDISMTGLSFVTDQGSVPKIGDVIKLEFPLHDGRHIAWWAQVARIEEYDPKSPWLHRSDFKGDDKILVGVRFHELPQEFMKDIEAMVKAKFTELKQRHQRERKMALMMYIAQNFWKLIAYTLCILAAAWILYYLTLPSETYDAKKGSPWGKRF